MLRPNDHDPEYVDWLQQNPASYMAYDFNAPTPTHYARQRREAMLSERDLFHLKQQAISLQVEARTLALQQESYELTKKKAADAALLGGSVKLPSYDDKRHGEVKMLLSRLEALTAAAEAKMHRATRAAADAFASAAIPLAQQEAARIKQNPDVLRLLRIVAAAHLNLDDVIRLDDGDLQAGRELLEQMMT